ncbi:hypothetical protein CRP143_gp48 [Roseobacter phage CRP-143]|nr:hypothetical protein CRP143_gp48 [Roseobacter phage CRP-143]
MSWGALAGMAMGAVQSYAQTQSYIQQLGYETASKVAGITATKEAYAADVDAFIIQNFINEELASNAMIEAERAGAANVREAQVQVKEGASKVAATGEGITGGASKARQLTSFYTQASKAVNQQKAGTTKSIIQIADASDKAKNDIMAKAEASYQKMRMAIAGVSSYSSLQAPSISDSLINIAQGGQIGMDLEQSYKDLSATNQ